jgi:hypothetical protein
MPSCKQKKGDDALDTPSIIVMAAGLALTILNIWDKIKTTGKAEGITTSDITTIKTGNATILVQLDKMDNKMDNYQERLVRVEESSKQAHKRIDSLEHRNG